MSNDSHKYVFSDVLSNKANSVVNRALRLANKHRCNELNCAHILCALLAIDSDSRDKFNSTNEIDSDQFIELIESISDDGTYGVNNSDDPVSISQCSEHAFNTLKNIIDDAVKHNRKAECKDIYDSIMSNPDNEVYDVLADLGYDPDTVSRTNQKMSSRKYIDMPTTMQFASDLCKLAESNLLDPISSRDDIIQKIIETLGRRHKANPCLIGDPGVGKTSIVEGLAQKIVSGDVPDYLKNTHIINVDISGILSGTKYRGDFEDRLNKILYEAARNPNAILFFDEFHTLMGAGSSSDEKSMDAANILKPAISKGDIRIIGATTTKEYTKFVEKDGAFERRIQPILVAEPSIDEAIQMVYKVAPIYSEYHNCTISNDAIEASVKLSDRFITNRKLPDKAINILDETAARLKSKHNKDDKIEITVSDIRYTISNITGIDINDIESTDRDKLNNLENELRIKVIGQNEAINKVVKAIRRSKAGIKDPNRPIGSFLFVGPTGVGKTELTKVIAETYFNGIKNLVRFDMSEFMEKHSVSKLVGAPPGYVGFGDGGQLTEAIKHNPYSIILFDEIEKAHPDVFNILLQVLDDGHLNDSNGTRVDFKNCLIIMTSNAGYGAEDSKSISIGFSRNEHKSVRSTEDKAISALENTFRPEFLNRLDRIVVFNALSINDCNKIVKIELNKISKRLMDKNIHIEWDDSIVDYISNVGFSTKYGARNLKRKIQEVIEDRISDMIIDDDIGNGSNIIIGIDTDETLIIKPKDSIKLEKTLTKA